MEYLFYIRLIGFTAGTLLFLFLLVLLAGLRRLRLFESLLFLTGICLFLCYAGALLGLNAEMYYTSPPRVAMQFSLSLIAIGMTLWPALLVHSHIEFSARMNDGRRAPLLLSLAGLFYLQLIFALAGSAWYFLPIQTATVSHILDHGGWFCSPWSALAFSVGAVFQHRFVGKSSEKAQSRLHKALRILFVSIAILILMTWLAGVSETLTRAQGEILITLLVLAPLFPGGLLGYYFLRQPFLHAGVQRNLVITVSLAFLALLYLTLAQRISEWLEPYFPPIATRSVLIFVLVFFFEPLQRRVGKVLQRAFRAEAEQLQRLTAEIQHVARAGNLAELISFAETRIRESFSLSGVRISLHDGPARPANVSGNVQRFILRSGPAEIGVLEAYFFGQSLSGETHAALDYLAEQLPAAIDLCRLLDEKLCLERELAERERLALLGQMAASVSHNLRNPLSSIKTLLQLQLENPGLPASARPDCEKAIAEVDRLNTKLTQLLRYAKPAVRAASGITAVSVDVAAISAQTVSLLQHEAERRGVSLTLEGAAEKAEAAGTEEALSDVLSNLIVNAIEAVPAGGSVRVRLARRDAAVVLEILDDGPGIPEYVRPRIFQPFFTTKPTGTGLGLAIVEKRLAEIGATIECDSPVLNARGTRFIVTLHAVPAGS